MAEYDDLRLVAPVPYWQRRHQSVDSAADCADKISAASKERYELERGEDAAAISVKTRSRF